MKTLLWLTNQAVPGWVYLGENLSPSATSSSSSSWACLMPTIWFDICGIQSSASYPLNSNAIDTGDETIWSTIVYSKVKCHALDHTSRPYLSLAQLVPSHSAQVWSKWLTLGTIFREVHQFTPDLPHHKSERFERSISKWWTPDRRTTYTMISTLI